MRAHSLVEGLRRGARPATPGCPCGCLRLPGVRDDMACARHRWRPSRRGVEAVVQHFEALGLLDGWMRAELQSQWRRAS